MNKADLIYKHNLQRILDEGCWDENPRPRYESDGAPAYSKFITQVFEEYDISKGEFPITTLRPIAIKGGINEMLAIYQTQTNSQEGFESHNVKWWSPWMNEEGNIGRAYPYNLESHRPNEMKREVVKVERKHVDEKFKNLKPIKVNEVDLSQSIDGKIYFDKFILLDDKVYDEKRKRYKKKIQFVDTGYIKIVENFDYEGGETPYDRTYANIGYIGDYKSIPNFSGKHLEILKRRWISMISRCYHNSKAHQEYKDDEIFVHQDWHSFEQFLKDVKYLPQYHLAQEDDFKGWELDKDYFGGNAYSKETCVWLKTRDNKLYRKTMKPFYLIDLEGNRKIFISTEDASIYLDCARQSVEQSLNKGCKVRTHETKYIDDGEIYRYELSRNQVNELLKSLKNDPFGRRHMISFFNWSNQDKKMLVECAFQTIWSVRKINQEQYLDCTLLQRSSDYPVAGHINQCQYVALQMMVAHHTGMKVGKFARFTQNLHCYDRHLDQVEEILNREPSQEQPQLILNAEGKSFYEIEASDFELINYNPVKPQLKFELGI
ncbi:thymidylate synthase [Klebsiella pneumoniae]|nr:thymidylate synthase [Klebsiella pneumoniae]MDS7714347.1 thymidylate synthase [Klebsiella pneumoniae]